MSWRRKMLHNIGPNCILWLLLFQKRRWKDAENSGKKWSQAHKD